MQTKLIIKHCRVTQNEQQSQKMSKRAGKKAGKYICDIFLCCCMMVMGVGASLSKCCWFISGTCIRITTCFFFFLPPSLLASVTCK